MGQQETMTVAGLKRIAVALVAALLMVATMAIMAGPAMADLSQPQKGEPPSHTGDLEDNGSTGKSKGADVYHDDPAPREKGQIACVYHDNDKARGAGGYCHF